jgi:sugar phosphate isomerase/epimerase
MNPISLEQLTVDEASPEELVAIAAALHCQHVSLFLRQPGSGLHWNPLVTDATFRQTLARRMADGGVSPYTVEFFSLSPRAQVEPYRPAFECAAELGAKRLSVLVSDPEEERRLERFCELCDRAAEFGLGVNVEFVAITQLRSLRDALRLVTRANRPNGGIMVDTLHLMRSGSTVAELAAADPRWIGGAQFSDGPLEMPADKQLFEALSERMLPGQGEFPLREFVNALPPGVPIGVEVPMQSLKDRGVGPMERARMAVEAARRVIGEAGAAAPGAR